MSILRREKRSWSPEPTIPPYPGWTRGGSAGVPSIGEALQVSAVWACVRLLADTVSMMPLTAYTMRDGIRTPIADPPLLLHPSADASMPDWLYQLMVSALLRGNAYGHIVRRDALGYPVQIELMYPDAVTVTQTNGVVEYRVNGTPLLREDVFHFRAYRFPGVFQGLSPLEYARQSIATENAVSDFAYGFFRDGAHPSSVFESDNPITQEQAQTIKERVMASIRGREPAVLGAGVTYRQIQISPEESQFLATQKYGTTEIARVFGVPPEMIAAEAGNSLTYANVEQRAIDFLTYSVQAWLTRIEAAFRPLMPGQKHVRFDTDVLVRTDLTSRMSASAIGIRSGQLTVDEARAMHDRPPLTPEQRREIEASKPKPVTTNSAGDSSTTKEPPA